ncbi:MAG: hypothetical protein H6594_12795, partial [Flavobacteriales bacterium]|nr:hypothetical protein [Flavobacteriales bacterium]
MRTTLRHLGLATATALFATATFAQQPNTIALNGFVIPCTPGDTVHVHVDQGIFFPSIDFSTVLTNNCDFLEYIPVGSSYDQVTISIGCQGVLVSASDSVYF